MFSDDVLVVLVEAGVVGSDVLGFVSSKADMSKVPGSAINVIDAPGMPGQRVQNKRGVAYDRPRVQITARAVLAKDAKSLATAARVAIDQIRNADVNGVFYQFMESLQPPFDANLDGQGRQLFKFNVRGECSAS
jgi:hypothetical protein